MSDERVVFLDVDGVCNSLGSSIAFRTYDRFDPISLRLLERASAILDFYFVLSSAWRTGRDLTGCKEIFSERKADVLAARLIGKTGSEPGTRGHQIDAWLARNPVSEYVIVDDDSDMLPHHMPRFIHTEHALGFRLPEYVRLLELFSPGHKEAVQLRRVLDYRPGDRSLHGTF